MYKTVCLVKLDMFLMEQDVMVNKKQFDLN
jgi:hypothetical protein